MPLIVPDPSPISLSPTFSLPHRCRARGLEVALLLGGQFPSFICNLMFSPSLPCLFRSSLIPLLSSFSLLFCMCFFFLFLFFFSLMLGVGSFVETYGVPSGIWCALRQGLGSFVQTYGSPSGIWYALRQGLGSFVKTYGVPSGLWCVLGRLWVWVFVCHHPLFPPGFQLEPKAPPPVPAPHVSHAPFTL